MIQTRNNGSETDIDELLAGMLRFYTPLISDTMDRLGLRSGVMDRSIQQILQDPYQKVCGLAYPSRVLPTKDYIEIDHLLEMVDNIPQNAFVVVSAPADIDAALWGGLMSARASARGAVGAVVNGGVRDIAQIAELGFPVFGAYRSVKDIRRRGHLARHNVPVYMGGVTIIPGDVVFADANGVVVVPIESFPTVYRELEIALGEESMTQRSLASGVGAREAFNKHGRF